MASCSGGATSSVTCWHPLRSSLVREVRWGREARKGASDSMPLDTTKDARRGGDG